MRESTERLMHRRAGDRTLSAVTPSTVTFTSATVPCWATHAWHRWMRHWRWFAVAALSIALWSWALNDRAAGDQWRQVLPLVGALLVWYALWVQVLERASDRRQRWALPVLAGAATLMSIALTHLSLGFWLLGLVFVALFFVVLPIWCALAASVTLTAHAGWESRFGGMQSNLSPIELFAFLLSRAIVATIIGLFLRSVVRLADRRERLAIELDATREQLASAAKHTGMMAERQRMARELHDTLTQGLSAVVMHLETAEQMLPSDGGQSRVQLQRARAIARESLDDTRRVVAALRPELLEHVELPEAVSRLCAQHAERNGVSVSTAVTGIAVPLHPEAEITLFRALQEGLSNVRKHARASTVTVTLSYMDDVVMLDVHDDGDGLAAERLDSANNPAPGGFGLQAMRERVQQLHGSMSVESEEGLGTTLTVSVPMLHTAEMPINPRGAM